MTIDLFEVRVGVVGRFARHQVGHVEHAEREQDARLREVVLGLHAVEAVAHGQQLAREDQHVERGAKACPLLLGRAVVGRARRLDCGGEVAQRIAARLPGTPRGRRLLDEIAPRGVDQPPVGIVGCLGLPLARS